MKTLIRRLELPDFNFFERGWSSYTEGAKIAFVEMVCMHGEHRLTIVGKDFDDVFVDVDAQFQIFMGG